MLVKGLPGRDDVTGVPSPIGRDRPAICTRPMIVAIAAAQQISALLGGPGALNWPNSVLTGSRTVIHFPKRAITYHLQTEQEFRAVQTQRQGTTMDQARHRGDGNLPNFRPQL